MIPHFVSHILFSHWLIHLITLALACRNKHKPGFVQGGRLLSRTICIFTFLYAALIHLITMLDLRKPLSPMAAVQFWKYSCVGVSVLMVTDEGWAAPADSSCHFIQATLCPRWIVPVQLDSSRAAFIPPTPLLQITLFWPGCNMIGLPLWLTTRHYFKPWYMGLNGWREHRGDKSGRTWGRTGWDDV